MKNLTKHGIYTGMTIGSGNNLPGSHVLRHACKRCVIIRMLMLIIAVAVLGLYITSSSFADGKGNGVQVIPTSPKLTDSQPGGIISASFQVTNKSAQSEEFIETLVLPLNWQAVIPPTSFITAPNEKVVRIVAFLAPIGTPAGKYQISYVVRSQKDYSIQDVGTLQVAILPVSKLAFMLESKPGVVVAGDEYEIKARLINQGNENIHILIDAKNDENYPATITPSDMILAAGGNWMIYVKIKTDEKSKRTIHQTIRIRAQAQGDKNIAIMANLAVPIDIYPQGRGGPDMYNVIPSRIKLQASGDGNQAGFQMELSGAGSIDQSYTRKVDYLLRTPDTQNTSFYGERDEYRFNYYSKNADLRLGDQSYSLSYLTDYFQYGRGAEIGYKGARNAFGAYFVQNRWNSNVSNFASYFSNRITDKLQLKFNYLNKSDSSLTDISENIVSIEAKAIPMENTNLSMEYAASNSTQNNGVEDSAYRVNLDGTRGDTSFTFGKIHADPDYFGYYNNADYTNGTISFPIAGRFRGHITGQRWTQNLNMDPLLYDAPLDTLYQAGLEYIPSPAMRYTFDCQYFRHQDLMSDSRYDSREKAYRLGMGRFFTNSSVQSYIDIGKKNDLQTGSSSSVRRCSIYYYLRASSRQYFTFFAQSGDNRPDSSQLMGGTNSVGASGSWQPADNLSLSLQYSLNGLSRNRADNNQLYFTANYGYPGERIWSLKIRQITQSLNSSKTSFYLSYTIPFGIPISRKTNIGVISGRVYDAQKPGNPGIPRAIVRANGVTAVTDSNGDFTINSLTPGNYSVNIEKSSIGLNRTTQELTPVLVQVSGGETSGLQIPVINASVLTGTVAMFTRQESKEFTNIKGDAYLEGSEGRTYLVGAGPNDKIASNNAEDIMVKKDGVGGIMIELTNGKETFRTLSDSSGDFSFEDLRPGNWKLKVYDQNLPSMHYLEKSELAFALTAGEEKTTILRVLPKLRQIKILEQGVILSQNNK